MYPVTMCPRGYVKSCATILGSPVVPEVKYNRLTSEFVFANCGRSNGLAAAILLLKSNHPSGTIGPVDTSTFSVGHLGRAFSTWSTIILSPVDTMAFIPAMLHR